MNWKSPVSNQEAIRRAGGRRRYNAQRQSLANRRRRALVRLIKKSEFEQGWQKNLAGVLGVSESTISRDLDTPLLQNAFEKWNKRIEDEADQYYACEWKRLVKNGVTD